MHLKSKKQILYTSLNLFLVHKSQAQRQQTFPAPTIYGDVMCTEPAHRFESTIKQKLDHNQDYPYNPEEWICEFCENDLMKIVKRICCGEAQRKRREAEALDFWHHASYQSHKLMTKIEHGAIVKSADSDRAAPSLASNLHPDKIIKNTIAQDCLDDLVEKHGSSRMKRSDGAVPSPQSARWHNSIRNGGKGRSTYDEALEKISCSKPMADDFLAGKGHNYDRKVWKHTYIQHECCGVGEGGSSTCEMDEIKSSYLQEECCHEGCRLEEIYEDCGAWRWDMKEYIEEMMG